MSLTATAFNSKNTLTPLLTLKDVHLSLASAAGQVDILRGIDVQIGAGETVSIVGPSGAGKSTLMMVAAGLEQPSRGIVEVAGHDLTAMNEDQLALFRRDNSGIIFQAFRLVPTMSAIENVAIPLELAGHPEPFDAAHGALEKVGLGQRVSHYPDQLSGGEQQRVAVARAFVADPKLLLADEPTGNLDGETGEMVFNLMFEMQAAYGTTLCLITHDLSLAARCERTIHLADGRVTRDQITAVSPQ